MKYFREYVVRRGGTHYGPFHYRDLAIRFTHEWLAKRYPHTRAMLTDAEKAEKVAEGFELILVKGTAEGLDEAAFLREELNEKLRQEAHTPEVYDDEEEPQDD